MMWFRLWHDLLDNEKIQQMPPSLFKAYINTLCIASKNDPRGTLPPLPKYAFRLRVGQKIAEGFLEKLCELSLVSKNGQIYSVTNWEKFQKNSDDVSQRVQRHRSKCNVTGNDNGNVPCNGKTPIDVEVDKETEKEEEEKDASLPSSPPPSKKDSKKAKPISFDPTTLPLPDCIPQQAWIEFCQHRITIKAKLTQLAAEKTIGKLERAYNNGYSPQDLIDQAIEGGWQACVFERHLNTPAPRKPITIDPAIPTPPYEEIVADYNANCPEMIEVEFLNDERRTLIDKNWYQPITKISGKPVLGPEIDKWKRLWPWLHQNCPFLSGKNDLKWKASLEWILNQDHLMNIVEGKYTLEA